MRVENNADKANLLDMRGAHPSGCEKENADEIHQETSNSDWFIHGIGEQISGEQYAKDFRTFRRVTKSYFPNTPVAGPSSAFWPVLGEPLGFLFGVHEDFMKHSRDDVDVITWHHGARLNELHRAAPGEGGSMQVGPGLCISGAYCSALFTSSANR